MNNRYKVYICKDGRYRAYDKTTKRVKSYPRILMENKLGRPLTKDEEVHHIDGDISNNSLDNLVVMSKKEHWNLHLEEIRKYTKDVKVKCVLCNKEFTMTPRQQRDRVSSETRGKHGPFCSRKCSGSYGRSEQIRRNSYTESSQSR